MWFNSNWKVLRKHAFILFGILPGIFLFAVMLITYIIAKNSQYHYLVFNSEIYAALILFPLMLFFFKKKNSLTTNSIFFNYLLLNSLIIGLVWGLTTSLYIIFINPSFPKEFAWEAVPPNAIGAETTVLPGTIELLYLPSVTIIWKLVFSLFYGGFFSLIFFFVVKNKTSTT